MLCPENQFYSTANICFYSDIIQAYGFQSFRNGCYIIFCKRLHLLRCQNDTVRTESSIQKTTASNVRATNFYIPTLQLTRIESGIFETFTLRSDGVIVSLSTTRTIYYMFTARNGESGYMSFRMSLMVGYNIA